MPRLSRAAVACALATGLALPVAVGGSMTPQSGPTQTELRASHQLTQERPRSAALRSRERADMRRVLRCNRAPYPGERYCPVEWNTRPSSHPSSRWYIPEPWMRAKLQRVGFCESGNRPTTNTGNGFYGKYQFMLSTWASVGGVIRPDLASEGEQDWRAAKLAREGGWGHWPVCGRR